MKNIFITCLLFLYAAATAQQDIVNLSYGTRNQNTLDLYLPKNYSPKTAVIIMVHGGAWMLGGKEYTTKTAKDLRNRGFVVANIDHRYVSESVHCKDLLADIDNAIAYMQKAAKKYNFSNEGYHMAGISAGSHLSLLYGYTKSRDIKSVSVLCSPTQLDTPEILTELNNKGLLNNVELLADAKYSGGQAVDRKFTMVSPYAQVKQVPTLLFHGDADTLVPYQQSELLYNVLQDKKIISKFITMPGKGHDCGMNDADTEKQVLDEISNWVMRYN